MNIFEALKKDHEEIKFLLGQLVALDSNDSEGKATIIQEIRNELIPHSRAEESVFYNSLRALHTGSDEVMHGYREHIEAEVLLRALQVEEKIDMDWKSTAKKLKQALEHHIEEEENQIFAIAQKAFQPEEVQTLGKLFLESKPRIEEEGFMKNTMEMMINLLPPRVSAAVRNLKAS